MELKSIAYWRLLENNERGNQGQNQGKELSESKTKSRNIKVESSSINKSAPSRAIRKVL